MIVDVAINSEIDAEKRVEALEKTNQQLESENFELKARLVQLEHEMKSARQQFVREQDQTQQQHGQQIHLLEQQLAKAKANSSPTEIDWVKCEEIVENLLVAGELPRELLFEKVSHSGDKNENEIAMAQAMCKNVLQELRKLGIEYALACLHVMKENTFFASNAAAELQEMMTKQAQTLELLETRLMDQKQESEQMKQKIQQLTEMQVTTSVPRSKSHSGVSSKRRGVSRADSSQSNSAMNFSDSDSDSDNDSEAAENHQYRHPQHHQHRGKSQHSTLGMVIANPPPAPPSASGKKSSESSRSSEDYSSKQSVVRQSTATDAAEHETKVPGKSGSDTIRKRMEILKNGSLFVKYGRFGKPHVRFVWCSPDLEYLNYRQVSKPTAKASIPTRTIQRIHVGQVTKVFERAKQPAREPYCFSIEYDDNRTLDLEVSNLVIWRRSKLEFKVWYVSRLPTEKMPSRNWQSELNGWRFYSS